MMKDHFLRRTWNVRQEQDQRQRQLQQRGDNIVRQRGEDVVRQRVAMRRVWLRTLKPEAAVKPGILDGLKMPTWSFLSAYSALAVGLVIVGIIAVGVMIGVALIPLYIRDRSVPVPAVICKFNNFSCYLVKIE